MNYRHAFHAGNHADAFKHVVLLALCDALAAKPAPCFALDTHAGRGLYRLEGQDALRTGEASAGVARLRRGADPAIDRYLDAIAACRARNGADAYPGSPWLLAHALRAQDRIACCELQADEAAALKANLGGDPRVAIHQRDGYAALKALLPPKVGGERYARGLVLVDPPYEAQIAEFDAAFAALRDGLGRWPQATFALWYPIKQRRALQRAHRQAAAVPAGSALLAELLVRPDDSPLRMNGSGMLLFNPPFGLETRLPATLAALRAQLEEAPGAGDSRLQWPRPRA
jgi:23S rRNA (adenine2030-N6)-methyltransferase